MFMLQILIGLVILVVSFAIVYGTGRFSIMLLGQEPIDHIEPVMVGFLTMGVLAGLITASYCIGVAILH